MRSGGKTKDVLDISLRQHLRIIAENAEDVFDALELMRLLEPDIKSRIKHYSYCIAKSTESYLTWMRDDYNRKLQQMIRAHYS